MILKRLYLQPECDINTTVSIYMLCTSPVTGGSEDTGEEDWVI